MSIPSKPWRAIKAPPHQFGSAPTRCTLRTFKSINKLLSRKKNLGSTSSRSPASLMKFSPLARKSSVTDLRNLFPLEVRFLSVLRNSLLMTQRLWEHMSKAQSRCPKVGQEEQSLDADYFHRIFSRTEGRPINVKAGSVHALLFECLPQMAGSPAKLN